MVLEKNVTKRQIFERKIIREVFGSVKDNVELKRNYELNQFIRSENVLHFIKAQRLSWLNHLKRMYNKRSLKKVVQATVFTTKAREDRSQDGLTNSRKA